MKMNRYIKAMEIGLANEKEGISFLELLKKMNKALDYAFNPSAESTFLYWFIENFESFNDDPNHLNLDFFKEADYYIRRKYSKGKVIGVYESFTAVGFESYLSRKFFLKGNAAKQYLDYLELAHATEQAKKASLYSRISIFIAIVAMLIGIIVGIYQVKDSPRPPFEVKVIEDNTKVDELQTQVEQLKEKLYKAEMTVKVMEGGSK